MRQRLLIYGGSAAAMTLLWFLLLHQPADRARGEIETELTTLRAQLEDYRSTVIDLPAVLNQQNRLQTSRAELASKLFAKEDILKLFRQLDSDVRAHRLQITEISPPVHELLALNKAFTTPDEPLFLNIRLTIRGDYIDFGRYVVTLEESPYYRGVNRCTIIGSGTPGTPTLYTIDFRALLGSTEAPA